MPKLVEFQGLKFLQGDFKISSDNHLFFQFVRLPKGGTAVELGAGFGFGTVILAKRFPDTEIFAVEYQQELFKLLIKNLALNKVKNVRPLLCDIRKEIEDCFPKQFADTVYANPPFWKKEFLTEESKKSKVYIPQDLLVHLSLDLDLHRMHLLGQDHAHFPNHHLYHHYLHHFSLH